MKKLVLPKGRLSVESFSKLKPAVRRVLIAKDVIKMLKSEQFVQREGYLSIYPGGSYEEDARKEIRNGSLECGGCIRAGIFMSCVGFRDNLKVQDMERCGFNYKDKDRNGATVFISKDFSLEQQSLIESYYEGKRFGVVKNLAYRKVLTFRDKFRTEHWWDKEKLMIAICENIIANNGTFEP